MQCVRLERLSDYQEAPNMAYHGDVPQKMVGLARMLDCQEALMVWSNGDYNCTFVHRIIPASPPYVPYPVCVKVESQPSEYSRTLVIQHSVGNKQYITLHAEVGGSSRSSYSLWFMHVSAPPQAEHCLWCSLNWGLHDVILYFL